MSINFTQTVSLIDRNCKSSSTSYPIAEKTADINLALDKVLSIIFKSNGKWQFDDYNHTDYPIITTNLVANQRDYAFTTDETGNLILEIYKVMVMHDDGLYYEIEAVDQQSDEDMQSFYNGQNLTGIPTRYDKTANGIFLDVLPVANKANGLKVFIDRESTYFVTTDTNKKAGFAGIFHEYLALRPSFQYCIRNDKKSAQRFENEMIKMEADIKKYYRDRGRDEQLSIGVEDVYSV